MNTRNRQPNIAFLDLDTLTDVLAWDNQLTASLADSAVHLRIGDLVMAMRGLKVVATGRITNTLYVGYTEGFASEVRIRVNLQPLAEPVLPTPKQRNIMTQLAKATKHSFPKLKAVLPIPLDQFPAFKSLFNQLCHWPELDSNDSRKRHHTATLDIIDRQDITAQARINLLLALEGRGALADFVFERDEARIKSDTDDMGLQVTRIVPWEACTDEMKTDPDNYILVEEPFAEHFSFGLVSLRNTGRKMLDPALDKETFNHETLNYIEYPELNKSQKKYMAYHREHVYKQWRSVTPKPQYGEVTKAGLSKMQEVNSMLSGMIKSWNLAAR
jgi:hypothetical protein